MKNLIPMPKAISTSGYIILAMLLSLPFAAAQERFINALSGAQIVNNAVFTVSDDKFASLPIAGSTTVSVEDRVVLEIDEDALVAKTSSNITLTLSVRLWTGPAASPVTVNETLNLNYTNTASGNSPHRVFRLWNNYHKVEVTITGITYTNTLPPLKLIGEILVNRKYAFATGTPLVQVFTCPVSSKLSKTSRYRWYRSPRWYKPASLRSPVYPLVQVFSSRSLAYQRVASSPRRMAANAPPTNTATPCTMPWAG